MIHSMIHHMVTYIITHRGLDPSRDDHFTESSLEAFRDHLSRGYGIEFDVRFSKDEVPVVFHDASLARLTHGSDTRQIVQMSSEEIVRVRLDNGCSLGTLHDVLALIEKSAVKGISALHLKHEIQESRYLDRIIGELGHVDLKKILVFDVKPEAARYLRSKIPNLSIAPSVSHPYDILRYGTSVGNSLITLEEAMSLRQFYDWVWLDEWDRKDANENKKTLFSKSVFDMLHRTGFKIALVTPELHAQSPGLLGNETHEDASGHFRLMGRIGEIIALGPDAICTDYPDEVMRDICRRQRKES